MKSVHLAMAAAAIGITTNAFAEQAGTPFTNPNLVRCKACGAQYHAVTKVKDGTTIQIKLEPVAKSTNPKIR